MGRHGCSRSSRLEEIVLTRPLASLPTPIGHARVLHSAPSRSAVLNLLREGIDPRTIHRVGNIGIGDAAVRIAGVLERTWRESPLDADWCAFDAPIRYREAEA